ncbi:hypothetical protein E4P40_04660 [Blastococcus sp. CT_GayMR20]|uniref:CBU_0592 family membrane protein n=1 Tax=Blastococcus sp. CT_GayMR20 TaxID=2559609 RepID=UPI00107480FD|nr:hypothetical protein [Blastococcus sp. CT_GayMR20]TFV91858.1 hypothetical protein E4P40_04405 [Blastococcus sp. CT_GayMR20]TFV91905.1 hypothetical protein E4P40_04660 [Blastococcus sp. CT_GayMR20]
MVYEVVGWFGAALGLAAYGLAARGRWPATGWRNAVANIVAGSCLLVNGLHHSALPSVGLNVVWTLIGIGTLLRARGLPQRAAGTVVGAPLDADE